MKVHLIKKKTIEDYILANAGARAGFAIWLRILKGADWVNTNDILKSFTNADILGNGTKRVVFDIGGNKYRCICDYSFGEKFFHIFINWIGTHAEYSKVCEKSNQYIISIY